MSDHRQALETLAAQAPVKLPATQWRVTSQREEDLVAVLIGDFDPMHNESEWATEVGLGGAVMLGAHVMSLLPSFLREAGLPVSHDGSVTSRPLRLGRVRIPTSLPVGSRYRAQTEVRRVVEAAQGEFEVTTAHTIEIDGMERPFMVVDEFVFMVKLAA